MVGRRCLSTAVVDEGCQVVDCQSDGELALSSDHRPGNWSDSDDLSPSDSKE